MVKNKKPIKNKIHLEKVDKVSKTPFIRIKKRFISYLGRRPHRSFRPTRRRDYIRPLHLPGYWAFTSHVRKTLWKNRKIFIYLAFFYMIATFVLVGIGSQNLYSSLTETMEVTSGDAFSSFWGQIGKSSLLFFTTVTGGLSQDFTEVQQILATIITLSMWLTGVWLLRNLLAGHKVKFRDGLYNAGAPIISTFAIALLLIIQLLPVAIALIGYGAAISTGLLSGGVEAMLFWAAAGLLTILSLYLVTSTVFALIIVTLPGMYPFKAIKTAGDLVLGHRLKILFRLIWMGVGVILSWVIIMIPMIMFDLWIKSVLPIINWLPIIPVLLLILSSVTIIWVSSYIYLLYRKVVDNEVNPV